MFSVLSSGLCSGDELADATSSLDSSLGLGREFLGSNNNGGVGECARTENLKEALNEIIIY
jgi:hypothetical protein